MYANDHMRALARADKVRIDALSDEFERAIKAGESPHLEDFLIRVVEVARPAALRELLKVEVELRSSRGERVNLEEYLDRFPQLTDVVRDAFEKSDVVLATQSFRPENSGIETATRAAQESVAEAAHLSVRCPSCHAQVEVAVDTALTDVNCSACGSRFSLISEKDGSQLAPPLATLGRFELVSRLGMGAFGAVWKARDKQLDRTVAIKIPRAGGMTAEEQEKFFREARAAAQLRHPGIVSVHEVGRDGDRVYIVSDFVRGVTLSDWLTGQQPTNRVAADLCATIADALHHAHQQGVVHRDLKPANIMIDGEGRPHLMDFGLARREVGEVTVTIDGQIMGTPAYMSPEQAQGESHAADCRSDVYSLGVIFFQLLTGELPFRGNMRMLMHQVIHDEPPSPRKLSANVSKDLETITLKCLEKPPARRYQTAKELAAELRRFMSGEPILARPISRLARAWRWAKRRPAAAAFLVLLAVVSIAGPIVAVQQTLLRSQRDSLLTEREQALVQIAKSNEERGQALEQVAKSNEERGQALARLDKNNQELQSQLVRNLIERGSAQCESGSILQAIAIFGRAYEIARQDDPLRSAARNLAANWSANAGFRLAVMQAVNAAFSEDGLSFVTAGRSVKRWETKSGKLLGESIYLGTDLFAIAFSPDGNKLLVQNNKDKSAQFVDVRTGDPLGAPMHFESRLSAAIISPDGHSVLLADSGQAGGQDAAVHLMDVITGKPIIEPLKLGEVVRHMAFSADGRKIFIASQVYIHSWDAATGKAVGLPIHEPGYVSCFAVSPDSQSLVTGDGFGIARLWNIETAKPFGEPMRHDRSISYVTFSVDGRRIATASHDNAARIWDVATGKPLGSPLRHDDDITQLAFSPDGQTLLTASNDRTTRLWSTRGDSTPVRLITLDRKENPYIQAMAVSVDGRLLLTSVGFSSGDGKRVLQIWDSETGKAVGQPINTSGVDSPVVAISSTGRTFLAANDRVVQIWEVGTGRPLGSPMEHDYRVDDAAFIRNGTQVLTRTRDDVVRLWDADTGRPLGEPNPVVDAPFHRLVSLYSNRIDDSAKEMAATFEYELPSDVIFSRDGKTFLTGKYQTIAGLCDAATGKQFGEPLRHDDRIADATFSPDGTMVLIGGGNVASLWDAVTGKPLGKSIRFEGGYVCGVGFGPNGRTALVAASDRVYRLDVPLFPDKPGLINAWAAARSGMVVDEGGLIHHLSQEDWLSALDDFERIRATLPEPDVISWVEKDRRDPESYPENNDKSADNDLKIGTFSRAWGIALGKGPDAVNEQINAAVAYRDEEVTAPMDGLILGELRIIAGDPKSAEAAIRAAIYKGGDKSYFYKSLGWSLLAQGKGDEARTAFQDALKDFRRKEGVYDLAKADPDQITSAFFLDLIDEKSYIEHFASQPFACFPWFYVAQRLEIEGKQAAAIAAYQRCVRAGRQPHPVQALAEWRLRKLHETSSAGQK